MKKLYDLECQIRRIIDQEYDGFQAHGSRTVREVCDRIKSRVSNSFNLRYRLNDKEKEDNPYEK
jgi:hypothetical protein